MILVSMALLGFAVVDLVRWSPSRVSRGRAVAAVIAGAIATVAMAALSGADGAHVPMALAVAGAILSLWVTFDYPPLEGGAGVPLAWLTTVFVVAFACSGSVDPISGPLGRWYGNLGFEFVTAVSVDQFLLGLSALLFLAASANRIVRLVLDAAGVSLKRSESALTGGRILGPLERFIVFAIVLAGDPAAAAIVVTGKGLLRFPEIRTEARHPGPDAVTEYFLIGTFTSLVVASLLAVLVLASG